MDKLQSFIDDLLNQFHDWSANMKRHGVDSNYKHRYDMEEQAIIHLHNLNNKKNVEIAKLIMEINVLKEHIDCLENNPFRRIYNWVVSVVKYRIKLVKIGSNKNAK